MSLHSCQKKLAPSSFSGTAFESHIWIWGCPRQAVNTKPIGSLCLRKADSFPWIFTCRMAMLENALVSAQMAWPILPPPCHTPLIHQQNQEPLSWKKSAMAHMLPALLLSSALQILHCSHDLQSQVLHNPPCISSAAFRSCPITCHKSHMFFLFL